MRETEVYGSRERAEETAPGQIKTTMRYHLTPVRMAISSINQSTSAGKDVEKMKRFALLVGRQTGIATVENNIGDTSKN